MSTPSIQREREFKLKAVAVANKVRKTLTGSFNEVQGLIDSNDLVFAVWQDASEADGVGFMIVKGAQRLRNVVSSNVPAPMDWTAIPCTSAEQAIALRSVAGEPDRRN